MAMVAIDTVVTSPKRAVASAGAIPAAAYEA